MEALWEEDVMGPESLQTQVSAAVGQHLSWTSPGPSQGRAAPVRSKVSTWSVVPNSLHE